MQRDAIEIPSEHAAVLVDPSAYADGRIYDTYDWLRANNPIGLASPQGFDPFWVIARYDDVREISRDNRRFPYGNRSSMLVDKASDEMKRALTGGSPNLGRSLISIDPPEHMRYRLLTQAWFMPKNLKTLDAEIAALADRTAALLLGRSGCDFVEDVALRYPLEVIMSILGVPEEDLPFMLRLTQEVFAPLDPDSMPEGVDPTDPAAFAQAIAKTVNHLDQYFRKITEDRRANPRSDVASIIANAKIDGALLPPADILGYYTIIATAGHDTTSTSSSAAMYALATQPETFQRVKADLSLVPRLVEEAIRWATPVKTFMRSAAADTEYGGRHFATGDWLMLCYASANCDESRFADGRRFDIDRPKAEHLAFGFGAHMCLGQHLARRELVMLFERIIPMLKSVKLAGEPAMTRSFFVNGLKRLPIEYELDDAAAGATSRA